jgi:hypothetical protein
MALLDDIQTAADALKALLDGMEFLDPGGRDLPDEVLVAEILASCSALTADGIELVTDWRGAAHAPTAEEMADWLFDGYPPSQHALTFMVRTLSGETALRFTTDVPFPWRS